MEGEGGRIFESSNWTRRNKNGEGEGKRSLGVADTEMCQGCSKIPGIGKLLLLIHRGICNCGKAATRYGKKE